MLADLTACSSTAQRFRPLANTSSIKALPSACKKTCPEKGNPGLDGRYALSGEVCWLVEAALESRSRWSRRWFRTSRLGSDCCLGVLSFLQIRRIKNVWILKQAHVIGTREDAEYFLNFFAQTFSASSSSRSSSSSPTPSLSPGSKLPSSFFSAADSENSPIWSDDSFLSACWIACESPQVPETKRSAAENPLVFHERPNQF